MSDSSKVTYYVNTDIIISKLKQYFPNDRIEFGDPELSDNGTYYIKNLYKNGNYAAGIGLNYEGEEVDLYDDLVEALYYQITIIHDKN